MISQHFTFNHAIRLLSSTKQGRHSSCTGKSTGTFLLEIVKFSWSEIISGSGPYTQGY